MREPDEAPVTAPSVPLFQREETTGAPDEIPVTIPSVPLFKRGDSERTE